MQTINIVQQYRILSFFSLFLQYFHSFIFRFGGNARQISKARKIIGINHTRKGPHYYSLNLPVLLRCVVVYKYIYLLAFVSTNELDFCFWIVFLVLQDEQNEEMSKQKIRLDREMAEKNEAFERIRELDGKVNSAATLVSMTLGLQHLLYLIFFMQTSSHGCRVSMFSDWCSSKSERKTRRNHQEMWR